MESTDIESILKEKDYYKILGLNKQATSDDIRKAYKKLAVKYHPDKNKHPKSADAFKIISHAFSVLSDNNKKQNYDSFGHEDGLGASGNHSFNTNFHADIDPFDLFNSFFNGGGFGFNHSNSFNSFKVYQSEDGTMYFSSSSYGHDNEENNMNRSRRTRSRDNDFHRDIFSELFSNGQDRTHRNPTQNNQRRGDQLNNMAKVQRNIQICFQMIPVICFVLFFVIPILFSYLVR